MDSRSAGVIRRPTAARHGVTVDPRRRRRWHEDTKSRRTLALPPQVVEALKANEARQERVRKKAGRGWHDQNSVFCTKVGTELDAANVRRGFRAVVKKAGLDSRAWTSRELRHSFISLMSEGGVPVEDTAPAPPQPNSSTAGSCGRSPSREPTRWALCSDRSRLTAGTSSLVGSYNAPSQDRSGVFWLVGDTGLEPVTSSV